MSIATTVKSAFHRRAFREGSAVLIDHGLISIAMFVTGVLLARSTPMEAYGRVQERKLLGYPAAHTAADGISLAVCLCITECLQ